MLSKKILAIDIGIVNLGYVFVEQDTLNVIECNRVNITQVVHKRVEKCNCKLYHDNCIPDYIDHFIQEHQHIFDEADLILIERQPPVGITNVQDLIFTRFRSKVKLISPNSIHKHFKMTKNDYELRKQESEKITESYLKDFENFQMNIRKHDITDAMLLVIYYTQTLEEPKVECLEFEQFRFCCVDFEQFRFFKK
jgi:hypothetical protein